jgi:indolepyruvate ferredoxin oxidoreductase alpha subunit
MQKIFKRYNPIYANDIGCYSLGVLPPLNAADMLICMGASIPMATSIAQNHSDRLGVAVIGDSTFWHSGLSGLANAIWQQANIIVVVMDNDTTAMTGAQPNPSNTRERLPHGSLDIAKTAEAMGAKVWVMNPMEYDDSRAILREVVATDGVRVIVSQYPCALIENKEKTSSGIELKIASVDQDLCNGCHICIDTTGCPGLKIQENGKITIDPTLCNGCSYCSSHCHRGGITTISRSELSEN